MNNTLLFIIAAVIAVVLIRTLLLARPGAAPAEAQAALTAGTAVLIDVREPAEWSTGVAQPAALLSLSDLRTSRTHWQPFLEQHRGKRLFLYCASGARSGSAAALLRREGHNAVNLGGLSRWTAAGLPLRPKP